MSRHILIAYYTRTGNTRRIAQYIQDTVGGELFEIQPATPYPRSYNAVVEQAGKEIKADYRPALKAMPSDIKPFGIVFVGSPNWWSTIAPPVATFLAGHDLSAKTVVPFCTHGGGGQGRVAGDVAKLCPQSTILKLFEAYGNGGANAQAAVGRWLREIGIV